MPRKATPSKTDKKRKKLGQGVDISFENNSIDPSYYQAISQDKRDIIRDEIINADTQDFGDLRKLTQKLTAWSAVGDIPAEAMPHIIQMLHLITALIVAEKQDQRAGAGTMSVTTQMANTVRKGLAVRMDINEDFQEHAQRVVPQDVINVPEQE